MINKTIPEYTSTESKNTAEVNPYEPLEAGQSRWVRITKDSKWSVVEIQTTWYDPMALEYFMCGVEGGEYVDDCYEWGPVIHPPVDKQ